MTLEEKVGQLLMVSFRGEEANEDARKLIQEIKVGGIIYYNWANGLHSPKQIKTLSASLQKLAEIPLFIAADQEGGVVARLECGFTIFPGNNALGQTGDPTLAHDAALAMGKEMKAVGVNMNLAPVVDVNCNPKNPVIGIRSFGDDAETVSAFGAEALRGYGEARVIKTLKHYPGHGDTAVDSHETLPVVHKSMEELEKVELLPFSRLAPMADAIMTAHILVPALDEENCTTLSEKSLNYLRKTIGFQGVIVADSLIMKGVTKKCQSIDEAAILALKAGCDILMLGGRLLEGERAGFELSVDDIQHIFNSLVEAVKTGRISEARVDEAARKVLHLKTRYLGVEKEDEIDWDAHRESAQKIASLALKITGKNLVAPGKKISIWAPKVLQKTIEKTSFANCPFLDSADVLFIFSYNAWKDPAQIAKIQSLLDLGKPAALIVTRDPVDASLFPEANFVIQTFSPTTISIQAVHNLFKDVEPIDPLCITPTF
jgi:beta-N-acetylhexosaminidase